jgi:hypothetical protein
MQCILPNCSVHDVLQASMPTGCIAQTVWNVKFGLRPDSHIVDDDVFYYDLDTRPSSRCFRHQARISVWRGHE